MKLCLILLIVILFPVVTTQSSSGERRALVVLVNFQDRQTQPFTTTYARDVVFNRTDAYMREVSYSQAWLVGDTVGWFTIASSYTTCDMGTIASQADAAAQSAGANLANYDHFIYMFPANACPFTANSTIGGSPSRVWLKGQRDFMVIAHELGHNLGLWHSRSYDCGTESTCAGGIIDEYGDRFDLMGPANTGYAAHYNAYQKERLGWLAVIDATAHGDYVLENYEANSGVRALKIAKAAGEWYYVEKRAALGFDSFLTNYDNVRNGVLIHLGRDSGTLNSDLLDMTPATSSWYDPALSVGQTFSDENVSITLVSVDSNGAVVNVGPAASPTPTPMPTPTPTPLSACNSGQVIGNPPTCVCLTKTYGNPKRCR